MSLRFLHDARKERRMKTAPFNFKPYDKIALAALVDHLTSIKQADYEQLNSYDKVAKLRLVDPFLLALATRAEGDGWNASRILDATDPWLQEMDTAARGRYQAMDPKPFRGNKPPEELKDKVKSSEQLSDLITWIRRMREFIVQQRVNAVPLGVRVQAAECEFKRVGWVGWANRLRRAKFRRHIGVICQVCVDIELGDSWDSVLARAYVELGISKLSELELTLWLGRHGLQRHLSPALVRTWLTHAREVRGQSQPLRSVPPQITPLLWNAADFPDSIIRCTFAAGEREGSLLGYMVIADQNLLSGDFILDGDKYWLVDRVVELEIGNDDGWFCCVVPTPVPAPTIVSLPSITE
jgi:hypothetical protein